MSKSKPMKFMLSESPAGPGTVRTYVGSTCVRFYRHGDRVSYYHQA